ncbi:MAG TPA: FG-GAP repeat protein [Spirochaetia bacterium]|nr:FG-GAP repeat protein [Spirochaetia bacterium]
MSRALARVLAAGLVFLALTTCDLFNKTPLRLQIEDIATKDPEWTLVTPNGVTPAGVTAGSRFGAAVDMSASYAIVGAPYSAEGGTNRGAAFVFARQSDGTWQFQQKLTSETKLDNEYFGAAVAITGSYAVVSSTGASMVEVYELSAGTWTKVTEFAKTGTYGFAVDIDGPYLAVGSYGAGTVDIYYRSGTWAFQRQVLQSSAYRFGYSLSLSGDYLAVGADYYNLSASNGGAVYVYQRSGTNWPQIAFFEPSTATLNERYGRSVAISNACLAVGARITTKVYFYKLNGSTWQYDTELSVPGTVSGDEFACSLATTGSSVIAGAYNSSSGTGCAYAFWNKNGTWSYKSKLAYSGGAIGDNFGTGVRASGNSMIIGAPLDDNSLGTDAGSIFFYSY